MADNKVTLTISFDDGADSSLHAAVLLDDELNKTNNGETKTSFGPGDAPYFLVHLDPKLMVSAVRCSSGSVSGGNTVVRTAETDINAGDAGDTADLDYIPSGAVSAQWYGNAPGMTVSGRTVTLADPMPCSGRATYPYTAHSYRYIPPAWTGEWRVHIVVHVKERT